MHCVERLAKIDEGGDCWQTLVSNTLQYPPQCYYLPNCCALLSKTILRVSQNGVEERSQTIQYHPVVCIGDERAQTVAMEGAIAFIHLREFRTITVPNSFQDEKADPLIQIRRNLEKLYLRAQITDTLATIFDLFKLVMQFHFKESQWHQHVNKPNNKTLYYFNTSSISRDIRKS